MQKQSYSIHFDPVPISSGDVLYFDTKPSALPYSESICKLHYHDKYEIGICVEGEGLFLSEGIFCSISKGDVIFIAPNRKHYSRSLCESAPCLCLFVHLDPKSVEAVLSAATKSQPITMDILASSESLIPPILHPSEHPKAAALLWDLVTECRDGVSNLSPLCEVRLVEFLLDIPNHFHLKTDADATQHKTDRAILSVAEYLSIHYDRNDTVEDLTKLCHLSESQLRRRFLAVYGIAPIAYRNLLRGRIAAELLCHTQLPIGEISTRMGYTDVSDFYRAFKKQFGTAPSLYRAQK